VSAQAQLGFSFEAEPQKQFPELLSPGIVEARVQACQEIVEEIADSPEVIQEPEQPTRKELEQGGQLALIDVGEWYEEAWKGMPEFVQKDLASYKMIYVHFETREDMDAFSKLIGQKIGLNTKSIWYPEAEITALTTRMRYIEREQPEGIDVIDGEE
jgi:hypothetical protein